MALKWLELLAAEQKISPMLPRLSGSVNYFMAHAEDNATDDAGRIASLQIMLSFNNEFRTSDVVEWFANHGVVV